MTHQSVKQNDATQWVQRFYEVAFECFFLNIKDIVPCPKLPLQNMHLIHCDSPGF